MSLKSHRHRVLGRRDDDGPWRNLEEEIFPVLGAGVTMLKEGRVAEALGRRALNS